MDQVKARKARNKVAELRERMMVMRGLKLKLALLDLVVWIGRGVVVVTSQYIPFVQESPWTFVKKLTVFTQTNI